jgi:hypothetical protein
MWGNTRVPTGDRHCRCDGVVRSPYISTSVEHWTGSGVAAESATHLPARHAATRSLDLGGPRWRTSSVEGWLRRDVGPQLVMHRCRRLGALCLEGQGVKGFLGCRKANLSLAFGPGARTFGDGGSASAVPTTPVLPTSVPGRIFRPQRPSLSMDPRQFHEATGSCRRSKVRS